jgi:PPOX class probable F420-dependent enzyme
MSNETSAFERFAGQKTVVLTTYRRDGTPVDTPIHIATENGHAYIRTPGSAFKAKRLRRHPEAELWMAGNGTAPALVGLLRPGDASRVGVPLHVRASELTGDASRRAASALARKYPVLHGLVIPGVHRLQRTRTLNLELTPVA